MHWFSHWVRNSSCNASVEFRTKVAAIRKLHASKRKIILLLTVGETRRQNEKEEEEVKQKVLFLLS